MTLEDEVDLFLAVNGVQLPAAVRAFELEQKGWRVWLLTLFPFAFEEEFSADHIKYWDICWSVITRIRDQKKYFDLGLVPKDEKDQEAFFRARDIWIEPDDYVRLLILGRGLAKSSSIEASAVMRGALLGEGYCLYVCESQDQAEEHIDNCRKMITNPDSRLTEFYPKMSINADAQAQIGKKKIKVKDRSDLFITVGGWICRAKGLNSKLRGLRIGNLRPDDIKLDDVDDVNDSIAVSIKKLKQITASVLPTQARRFATVDFGQNLIVEHGVMNRIHTGKSDALAARQTIGVSNTFEDFREGIEYKSIFDEETGRVKHIIQPCAVPTWAGVNLTQAQKWLFDYGLETFLAECQNQFDQQKTGKVFHEYNEARHLITRADFERKFGVPYIPAHWRAKATGDIGFSKLSLSTWLFTASAAQNSPLPARYFVYRAMTFQEKSIDDQAEAIWEAMFPDYTIGKRHMEASQSFANYPELFRVLSTKERCKDLLEDFKYNPSTNKYEPKKYRAPKNVDKLDPEEAAEIESLFYVKEAEKTFESQISSWLISHEKSGEQKTLAQKYGLPVRKTKHFKADSGVAEANHLLRGDYTQPHPFFEDEMTYNPDGTPTGLYKLGSPYIFFIVEDEKERVAPTGDKGMKTAREQISGQRWTEEKLTEQGLTKTIPMKFNSDYGDAFRIFASDYALPASTELNTDERFQKHIKDTSPHLSAEAIEAEPNPEQRSQKILSHTLEKEKFYKEESKDFEKNNDFADIFHEQGLDDDMSWINDL